MQSNSRGFILLEVLVLTLIIFSALGAMKMLDKAEKLNAVDGARSQAIFIAREQLERAAYEIDNGTQLNGTLDFLGDKSQLTTNNTVYTLQSAATIENGLTTVTVAVDYEVKGITGTIKLERKIKAHGT